MKLCAIVVVLLTLSGVLQRATCEEAVPEDGHLNQAAVSSLKAEVKTLQDKLTASAQELARERAAVRLAQDALNAEKETAKMLRERQIGSVAHCEEMLGDVHKLLSEEKALHTVAEGNASSLGLKLRRAGQVQNKVNAALRKAAGTLHQDEEAIAKLTAALNRANLENAALRSQLSQSEKVRTETAKNLSQVTAQLQNATAEDLREVTAVRSHAKNDLANLRKEVRQEQRERESVWLEQKQRATQLINSMTSQLVNLTEAHRQLRHALIDTESSLNRSEMRADRTEHMLVAEHRAMVSAGEEAAREKREASRQMQELLESKSALSKGEQDIQSMSEAARKNLQSVAELTKANRQQMAMLSEASSKLEVREKALHQAHVALRASEAHRHVAEVKLVGQSQARIRSERRLQQLWKTLKQKQEQLKVHDEDAANVRQQLAIMANTTNSTESLLRASEIAKEQELSETHVKLEYAGRVGNALLVSRNRIAAIAAKEHAVAVQLARDWQREKAGVVSLEHELASDRTLTGQLTVAQQSLSASQAQEKRAEAGAAQLEARLHNMSNVSEHLRQELTTARHHESDLAAKVKAKQDLVLGHITSEVANATLRHGFVGNESERHSNSSAKPRASDRDISGQALAEARREVQTMKHKLEIDEGKITKLSSALIKEYRMNQQHRPTTFLQAGMAMETTSNEAAQFSSDGIRGRR